MKNENKFMQPSVTCRGFAKLNFIDLYGAKCSLQKSSSALDDNIWLGVDDADPQIMASNAKKLGIETGKSVGWVKYQIPKEVLLNTSMHLNRSQVSELIKELQHFVDTGEVSIEP